MAISVSSDTPDYISAHKVSYERCLDWYFCAGLLILRCVMRPKDLIMTSKIPKRCKKTYTFSVDKAYEEVWWWTGEEKSFERMSLRC
jgi:hypothetical protein